MVIIFNCKINYSKFFFSDELDYVWTGMKYNTTSQKYQWCSSSISSYRKWCPSEPLLDVSTNKLCVAVKVNRVNPKSIARGCLKVFDCKTELPYVCHRRCNGFEFMANAVGFIDDILLQL